MHGRIQNLKYFRSIFESQFEDCKIDTHTKKQLLHLLNAVFFDEFSKKIYLISFTSFTSFFFISVHAISAQGFYLNRLRILFKNEAWGREENLGIMDSPLGNRMERKDGISHAIGF